MLNVQSLPDEGMCLSDTARSDATLLKAGGMMSHVTKAAITTSAGPLDVCLSEPVKTPRAATPLLVLHGISRGAEALFKAFLPAANAAGRVVIAPEFTRESWPVYQRITSKIRPDIALLELLGFLRDAGVIDEGAVEVFGFSGGAQLAHRFAMLYPHMISSLHVGSAGWYTLPQAGAPYPFGLSADGAKEKDLIWRRRMMQGLDAFLRIPVTISVGALDNQEEDAALRRNSVLDASQGCDRLTRARSYRDALADAAKARGIAPSLRFHQLPGCGHDVMQCIETGGLIDRILPRVSPEGASTC